MADATAAVGHALEQAAEPIAKNARISYRIADIIAKTDQEKDRAAALRIGCLVLFNALAFQDRLSAVNETVPNVREAWKLGLVGLRNAWNHICENIDYLPVFELAVDLLEVVDDGPEELQTQAIAPLVKAMEQTRNLEGHDLSGRLFHTLLTDAKFTGAYYTSVPAATLLARLVFHDWPPGADWKDHEYPTSLSIADLACGTGTLLMAVAAEAGRKHLVAGGQDAAEVHKKMVEDALHGYDVQLSAVHFAATSLAMLNPHIQFDRMNLYVMPLGTEGAKPQLGSLDFLGQDEVAVQHAMSAREMGVDTTGAQRVSGKGLLGAEEGVIAKLPGLDLAIMNPPFTRSVGGNLLFGSLSSAERQKLQKELARRLKRRQASATAGLGAAFVAAAAPKLYGGDGRLALVLPGTVCTGPSWKQTRALIERDFVLDMVITSHDPIRWNFSDSTELSEALLIATRRPGTDDGIDHRTTFINLWQNPDGVLDAHRTAQAIATTEPATLEGTGTALLEVDGQHVGEALSIPESKLVGRQWSGVQFARADLTRSALALLEDEGVLVPGEGSTASIRLCTVDELGTIGPDRRRLVDGFDTTSSVTAYPLLAGHDTEQRKSLKSSPDAYLSPLPKPRGGQRPGYADHLWKQASRLLIAERLRLDTVRIVAMRSETRVLSNVWWPVQVQDEATEKALAVWLNSSLGLLTMLAQRTSTEGSWVAMKKADLQELPVLDTRRLSHAKLKGLADLFDEMVEEEFERLPAMGTAPPGKPWTRAYRASWDCRT